MKYLLIVMISMGISCTSELKSAIDSEVRVTDNAKADTYTQYIMKWYAPPEGSNEEN